MKDVETPAPSEPGLEEPEAENGKMSFLEHLDELRQRLLRIIIYVGVGFLSSFYFAQNIYNFMSQPVMAVLPPGQKLVFTSLPDPFRLYMKVAILAGIFLTSPFILYEVWKFISPGLYRKEKKFAIPFLVCLSASVRRRRRFRLLHCSTEGVRIPGEVGRSISADDYRQ